MNKPLVDLGAPLKRKNVSLDKGGLAPSKLAINSLAPSESTF